MEPRMINRFDAAGPSPGLPEAKEETDAGEGLCKKRESIPVLSGGASLEEALPEAESVCCSDGVDESPELSGTVWMRMPSGE